jgi:hypothetical protein
MLRTNPDSAETTRIKKKLISPPLGICVMIYGSKNMNSEMIESGINIPTKIAAAKMIYL